MSEDVEALRSTMQKLTAQVGELALELAALKSAPRSQQQLDGADPAPAAQARINISGGSVWEPRVGYSRAVRAGQHFFVSGTTATSEGGSCKGVGAFEQARAALATIVRVLEANGARTEHVVRTRMFVVDIAGNADAVGRAHGEVFSATRPAATMVGVSALIDADMLVEIEADAVVPS